MTATGASGSRGDALDTATAWVHVVLGVGVLTSVWGTIFTFTVYAEPLGATFGLASLQVSSVFSVTTACFLVVGGVCGIFIARLPLRPALVAVGSALAVAGAALQFVESFLGVVAAFALLGTASGTAFIVVVSLIPQWFETHQGLATSVTMTGLGFGPLVLPPVWLWLLAWTDLRTAFAVVVGGAAGIVFAASVGFRRPPNRAADGPDVTASWVRTKLRDSDFLAALTGYALIWSWYYVLSADLVDILAARGIGGTVAVAGLSVVGGVSIATRVAGGYVGDRVGKRRTMLGSVVLVGVSVFALPFVDSEPLLYAAVVGMGIGLGPLASLWSPIVLTRFGHENATAIVGLLVVGSAGAAFLAPLAVSAAHTTTGGYAGPLVALSVVTVLGALLLYWGTNPDSG